MRAKGGDANHHWRLRRDDYFDDNGTKDSIDHEDESSSYTETDHSRKVSDVTDTELVLWMKSIFEKKFAT